MVPCRERSPTRLCPFSVLVQHSSRDGDEAHRWWISRWTTNWRANNHEPLLCWWHHPVDHFIGRATGVGGSPRPSQLQYILLINIDKTKVMASDGIACCILIQNEQLEQVNTFPYLGSLITEDGECTNKFRITLNRVQALGASLQKIWKSYSIPTSTKNSTNESASTAWSNVQLRKLDT